MACEQLWSTAKQSLIIAELLTALKEKSTVKSDDKLTRKSIIYTRILLFDSFMYCTGQGFKLLSPTGPRRQLLGSLSFALYDKRQTRGKEKFYGIRQ
jgi:hypothetical protein